MCYLKLVNEASAHKLSTCINSIMQYRENSSNLDKFEIVVITFWNNNLPWGGSLLQPGTLLVFFPYKPLVMFSGKL